nr:DUF4255 domain-containing protein [uncultured Psychroserpens sp.]
MIHDVFQFVTSTLNQYLKQAFSTDTEFVISNTIVGQDGSIPKQNQNKVILSLINIEQETTRPYMNISRHAAGNQNDPNVVERYAIDLLVTSNFDDYNETLKFLNKTISFFQDNLLFSQNEYPNMPNEIVKLEFQFEVVSYEQMHNLWTAMGAKYQPSILYKMRIITTDVNIGSVRPNISNPLA